MKILQKKNGKIHTSDELIKKQNAQRQIFILGMNCNNAIMSVKDKENIESVSYKIAEINIKEKKYNIVIGFIENKEDGNKEIL